MIIHVKDDIASVQPSAETLAVTPPRVSLSSHVRPTEATPHMRQQILKEVLDLEERQYRLGCRFIMAEQGDRLGEHNSDIESFICLIDVDANKSGICIAF